MSTGADVDNTGCWRGKQSWKQQGSKMKVGQYVCSKLEIVRVLGQLVNRCSHNPTASLW